MSNNDNSSLLDLNDCGCCEGVSVDTPLKIFNRPGLKAIAYSTGTHADFKESMLARLSSGEYRVLQKLTTRDNDDFSIALLDAWATVADVLTFYQERIANESYLRTAIERLSVLHLARLIGYELSLGVAASTYVAFRVEEPPKLPQQATAVGGVQAFEHQFPTKVTIEKGTKIQSIPGQDEKPQVFETVETIEARPEWNEIKPRTTIPQEIKKGTMQLYLKGVDTRLQPGDAILLVGDERKRFPGSERWDFRILQTVTPYSKEGYTHITWEVELGHEKPTVEPADNPKVFAFRQRAALFGYNAPDWKVMPFDVKKAYKSDANKDDPITWGTQWPNFVIRTIGQKQFLFCWGKIPGADDNVLKTYLEQNFDITWVKTATIEKIDQDDTIKVTAAGGTLLLKLNPQKTKVLLEIDDGRTHELVARKDKNVLNIYEQNMIDLDRVYPNILPESWVVLAKPTYAELYKVESVFAASRADFALTSKTTRIALDAVEHLRFFGLRDTVVFSQTEKLEIAEKPLTEDIHEGINTIPVEGKLDDLEKDRKLIISGKDTNGKQVSEVLTLAEAKLNGSITNISFNEKLKYTYKRDTVTIYGNAALATHGETVKEILGSGDGSQVFQSFTLKQLPLTYRSASTPNGAESTLEIRVNDILWKEVQALYDRGPEERIYITRIDNEGNTTVQFGDGKTGARLPSGVENVHATYRKGSGLEGNVKAGKLSLLMTRPLGVKDTINPLDATGADNPESLNDVRKNAPLKVLTLDRIVSLKDYEDFARAFAGIAKALATWTWFGEKRGVFITVAGPGGAEIKEDSLMLKSLIDAMRKACDPLVHIEIHSYTKVLFKLAAQVVFNSNYLPEKVLKEVEKELRRSFSFEVRDFGQPVTMSEVISVIQNVPGVNGVNVSNLERSYSNIKDKTLSPSKIPRMEKVAETHHFATPLSPGYSKLKPPLNRSDLIQDLRILRIPEIRLVPHTPHFVEDRKMAAAELITLDPGPIDLKEMK